MTEPVPGILDLPAPLFDAFDAVLAWALPAWAGLTLWGLLAAVVSMELYRALSPQSRLHQVQADVVAARRALAQYDGPFGAVPRLAGRALATAVRRLLLVFPAAVAASLPALCLLVWLDKTYDHRLPAAQEAVAVQVTPKSLRAVWRPRANQPAGEVVVTDTDGAERLRHRVAAPVDALTRWNWSNVLIADPAGYLPAAGPVTRIALDLPQREIVPFGPAWLRGWAPTVLVVFLLGALAIKRVRRIA